MASFPPVRTPSVDELVAIAADFGIGLSPALASAYRALIAEGIESYTRIDVLPEPGLPVSCNDIPFVRAPDEVAAAIEEASVQPVAGRGALTHTHLA